MGNTIRELKEQKKYKNMLKRKNKKIERLKTILEVILKQHLKESDIEMLYKEALKLKKQQINEWTN